jgi:hypothetical protein
VIDVATLSFVLPTSHPLSFQDSFTLNLASCGGDATISVATFSFVFPALRPSASLSYSTQNVASFAGVSTVVALRLFFSNVVSVAFLG